MKIDYVSEHFVAEQKKIVGPSDMFPLLKRYARTNQEKFIVISLDGAHHVIRIKMVTLGLVNRTIVHPREVFRQAILDEAVAIIIAHNHPSGNLEPSPEDDEITSRICKAGELIGISVLDHLIFSKKNWYAYTEHSKMPC